MSETKAASPQARGPDIAARPSALLAATVVCSVVALGVPAAAIGSCVLFALAVRGLRATPSRSGRALLTIAVALNAAVILLLLAATVAVVLVAA